MRCRPFVGARSHTPAMASRKPAPVMTPFFCDEVDLFFELVALVGAEVAAGEHDDGRFGFARLRIGAELLDERNAGHRRKLEIDDEQIDLA